MPLSTKGLAVQILSSLSTYRKHQDLCTKNDCQVVLNHLLRKFSEPLAAEGRQRVFRSQDAERHVGEKRIDHVIPIRELMQQLLAWQDLDITERNVSNLIRRLETVLLLCEIMPGQEDTLNRAGLQRRMPEGWGQAGHRYEEDVWARYKATGLFNEIRRIRNSRPSRRARRATKRPGTRAAMER